MKDQREEWYDPEKKAAVTIVDVTGAAQELARGHLSGPVAARYLAEALAAAALLGSEMSQDDETVSVQMKCSGPLGGYNVECTAGGELRGYTERKVLDGFDGTGKAEPAAVLGDCRFQITRSVPGKILSQGISNSLDGYLAGSLQRKAVMYLEAAVSDEVEILKARGVMVEELPDGKDTGVLSVALDRLSRPSRALLKELKLDRAERRRTSPLRFACRCSPQRAAAMLAALDDEERRGLGATVDITCHMCGRMFSVATGCGG